MVGVKSSNLANIRSELVELLRGFREICIAYSGGGDSEVLLHLVAEARRDLPEIRCWALHVDHQIQSQSAQWAVQCQEHCQALGIELIIRQLQLPAQIQGESLEALLRKLRYQIFRELLPSGGALLTAHHADDQLETLLLQLFRGSGVRGLAAMPKQMRFAAGSMVRPLLDWTRQELQSYACAQRLVWIDDPSNQELRFDRNYLRHQVLPHLTQRWPAVARTVGRASRHCAEAVELLEELAQLDLAQVVTPSGNLALTHLRILSYRRQKNLLRSWLSKLNLPLPSSIKLDEIINSVVQASQDASPLVDWSGGEVRRFRDELYAMPPLIPHDVKLTFSLREGERLILPADLGTLQIITHDLSKLQQFQVAFRRGGERLRLERRGRTHRLAKLMQEWQIPPWQRERIPLLYRQSELIAVADYYVPTGIQLIWDKKSRESILQP